MTSAINGIKSSEPFLRDVQAHILKHHGREQAYHLFLRFDNAAAARQWIARLPLSSAAAQLEAARLFDDKRIDGGPVVCFYLAAEGYRALGLADKMPPDTAFRAGMKNRAELLNDPTPEHWEMPHAMLLLADMNATRLEELLRDFRDQAGKAEITVISVQKGVMLVNDKKQPIEHFGYRDGISQPLFLETEISAADDSRRRWSQAAPRELVLTPDPGGKNGANSLGSYLVFRKLEQNVAAFKAAEEALSKRLFPLEPALVEQLGYLAELDGIQRELVLKQVFNWSEKLERAGALAIGRFEDGTPIARFDNATNEDFNDTDLPEKDIDDFDFSDDNAGSKCPFHAHIRKVNPRADAPERAAKMRIVRRGITYDEAGRNGNMEVFPEGGVGLLFMSFQSDIAEQFEAMQRAANEILPGKGIDPVIGQANGQLREGNWTGQQWPQSWGQPEAGALPASLLEFVTLKGGEYFFAPSLSFLQSLDNQDDETIFETFQQLKAPTMTNFLDPSDWQSNKLFFGYAVNYYNNANSYLITYALGTMGGGTPPPPPPPPLAAKSVNILRNLSFYLPYVEYVENTPPQVTAVLEQPDGTALTAQPVIVEDPSGEYYLRVILQPNAVTPGSNTHLILRVKVSTPLAGGQTYSYEYALTLPVG